MEDTLLKEKNFEEAIENYIITEGGYKQGNPNNVNRSTALDEDTFLKFIQTTQPIEWEKHCKNYPNNPEQALLKRFQDENNIYTKGPLSLVVQFTRLVQDKEFPLNPDDFQTSSKGQVAGLGGGNLKKILNGSLMISDFSKITFVSTI